MCVNHPGYTCDRCNKNTDSYYPVKYEDGTQESLCEDCYKEYLEITGHPDIFAEK